MGDITPYNSHIGICIGTAINFTLSCIGIT